MKEKVDTINKHNKVESLIKDWSKVKQKHGWSKHRRRNRNKQNRLKQQRSPQMETSKDLHKFII